MSTSPGSLLASVIVWVFIRNWRTVFISSIVIPTSIITTFTIMKMMDFTLNSMTLLGLTLAVGIVIDDAIIVLENIYRFIEEKNLPPIQAAIDATKEIALAVMATTLSLVIVFVPIAFMTGYARRYLNQFGWTMAFSIMVRCWRRSRHPSSVPGLCRRTGKGAGNGNGHEGHHGFFDRYVRTLDWSLDHRWVIVMVSVLTFASTFVISRYIGRDWMPQDDQSELSVMIELPEGSSLEATEKVTLEIAHKISKIPGVTTVVPQTHSFAERVTMANMTILLEDVDKRAPIEEMGQRVRAALREFPHTRPPA
jgi:HAE1 family hydrophobic/amphiphilic exporter-1